MPPPAPPASAAAPVEAEVVSLPMQAEEEEAGEEETGAEDSAPPHAQPQHHQQQTALEAAVAVARRAFRADALRRWRARAGGGGGNDNDDNDDDTPSGDVAARAAAAPRPLARGVAVAAACMASAAFRAFEWTARVVLGDVLREELGLDRGDADRATGCMLLLACAACCVCCALFAFAQRDLALAVVFPASLTLAAASASALWLAGALRSFGLGLVVVAGVFPFAFGAGAVRLVELLQDLVECADRGDARAMAFALFAAHVAVRSLVDAVPFREVRAPSASFVAALMLLTGLLASLLAYGAPACDARARRYARIEAELDAIVPIEHEEEEEEQEAEEEQAPGEQDEARGWDALAAPANAAARRAEARATSAAALELVRSRVAAMAAAHFGALLLLACATHAMLAAFPVLLRYELLRLDATHHGLERFFKEDTYAALAYLASGLGVTVDVGLFVAAHLAVPLVAFTAGLASAYAPCAGDDDTVQFAVAACALTLACTWMMCVDTHAVGLLGVGAVGLLVAEAMYAPRLFVFFTRDRFAYEARALPACLLLVVVTLARGVAVAVGAALECALLVPACYCQHGACGACLARGDAPSFAPRLVWAAGAVAGGLAAAGFMALRRAPECTSKGAAG